MKKLPILVCLSLAAGLFATACSEEEDCSGTARPQTTINVCQVDAATLTAGPDTLEALTVTAMGTDSVLLNRGEDISTLSLPLRYTVDSTQWVLHYQEGVTDTLSVRHTNTPYFVSMDCGYQMKQVITSVSYTRHYLDSVSITSNQPGIYGIENIQIFH